MSASRSRDARPLLEVRELTVRYARRGGQPLVALEGVSFELACGERLAVVGASGSGKSSLARALVGFTPHSGVVRLLTAARAPRPIQLVFQDAGASLNPRRRIGAVLQELLDARRARGEGVAQLLADVGLPPQIADAAPHQLSGGQRQRAAIARALAADPQVLVCDEILSALDAPVQVQILELLEQLVRARSLGVVFVTHDLAVARRWSDRVAVLHGGRLVELGPAATIFDAPRHAHTRELWNARLRWPEGVQPTP